MFHTHSQLSVYLTNPDTLWVQEVNKSLFSTVQSTGVALPYTPVPYFYVQYSPKSRTTSPNLQFSGHIFMERV